MMDYLEGTRFKPLAEVSLETGIPVRTLQRWCQKELVPSYKRGPKIWFIDSQALFFRATCANF